MCANCNRVASGSIPIAPASAAVASGFLQVVVSKATAADSDEATNFSSAVASDTTLGLTKLKRYLLRQRKMPVASYWHRRQERGRERSCEAADPGAVAACGQLAPNPEWRLSTGPP